MKKYIILSAVLWITLSSAQGDSLNVRQISRAMYGTAFSSWVFGNYAYVATGSAIIVLDISDISNPTYISHFWMPDISDRIWFKGSHLYTASELAGLRIIDVSDVLNPQEVGFYSPPASFIDIFIRDSLAYLANSWNDFRIVNIENPSNPQLIGQLDLVEDPPRNLDVADSFAYLVGEEGHSLRVVNISNPTNPFEAGWCDIGDSGEGVFVRDTLAFIACASSGLRIFNVAEPTNIIELASYNTPGQAWDVIVDSNYAYIADDTGGLRIIDVSDVFNPVEVSFYDTPGCAFSLFGFADYICVSDLGGGWWVIDISNPLNPVKISDYFTGKPTYHLAVQDSLVYVALSSTWSPEGGMRIFNISNPASPESIGYCNLNDAYDVDVSGDYAYTCGWDDTLRVISISNPQNPVEVGKCNLWMPGSGIELQGSYAYIAVMGGLEIISDVPSNPQILSYCPVQGVSHNLSIMDTLTYIASDSGLFIVNTSNPSSPSIIGNMSTKAPAWDVDVSEDYAYMATCKWVSGDSTIGLEVINIADPTNPQRVGFYNTLYPLVGITVAYPYAYVGGTWGGLLVFNVSDPTNPQKVGYYDTGDVAWSVTFSNGLAYVPCQTAGFYILEYYGTGIEESARFKVQKAKLEVYPNPSNSSASIRYSITRNCHVELRIYNLAGQLVRTLVDEQKKAGIHSVTWDGRDEKGRNVASGVYFCQLKSKNYSEVKKCIMLK